MGRHPKAAGTRSHDQLHVGFRFTADLSEMMAAIVAHRSKLAGVPVSVSAIVRHWIEAHVGAEYDAIVSQVPVVPLRQPIGGSPTVTVAADGRLVQTTSQPTWGHVSRGGLPMDAPDDEPESPTPPAPPAPKRRRS
jgi:hypothetical protein